MTQTCATCGRSWGDRAMFCGVCGALLDRPMPRRGEAPSAAGWRRRVAVGGVLVAAVAAVVASVPTLSIDRTDPIDTSISVPDSDDLQAAPADATIRPRVDPPEITCSAQGVEFDCVVWSRQLARPASARAGPQGTSDPVWALGVGDGVVILDDGRLERVDAADGTRTWSVDALPDAFPLVANGEVVAISGPATTSVIDLADGHTRWTTSATHLVTTDGSHDDVIYTSTDGDDDPAGMAARDIGDGAVRWVWPTEWRGMHVQQLGPDRLLVISHDDDASAAVLAADTGQELTRLDDFGGGWVLGVGDGTAATVRMRRNADATEVDAAGDGGAVLTGIDLVTGAVAWEQEVRAFEASFGVHGRLVLAPSARHLTALDMATGEVVWEVATASSEVVASQGRGSPFQPPAARREPAPTGHVLTVDQREGWVRARAPDTGEVVWERALEAQPWGATAFDDEVVVFGPEHLHLLEAATGVERLRLTVADHQLVGLDPLIVHDHRSGYTTRVDVPAREP